MIGRPDFDYNKPDKPKSVKDFPRYFKELAGGFFYRLFYIFRLVWETSPAILILLTVTAVVQGILPVLGTYFMKNIVNALQSAYLSEMTSFATILSLLIVFFVYSFLKSFIGRFDSAIKQVAGELLITRTKLKIMEKAKDVDISSFDKPEFYEKLENANREASNRPIHILSSAFTVFSTLITLVSFVVILSEISFLAALAVLLLALPSAIVNFAYRRKTFLYMRRRSKDRRQMNYYSDLLVKKEIVKEIRLFGLSETFINRFKAVFKKYFAGLKKLIIRENVWHVVISVFSTAVNCAFFSYVAYKCFKGEIMIGDYTYYTGALTSIASNVATMVTSTSSIYEGTLFIDNIISFMKEKVTVKANSDAAPAVGRGDHKIEFKNVSFKYPGTEKYVLKNINAEFSSGETVVLVGVNGAGKTTLIKLLTRLYDPTEGEIILDGRNIKEYDPKEIYRLFGIIFQDFGQYAETVSDNVAFGEIDVEKDDGRIKTASVNSGADTFINRLPKGYETPLMRIFEPEGTELSIGQWQKLAVARAFYGDHDILILDEPTASLDAFAEQEIFSQFDKLREGKITIFVSHRLSSATIASKIIVLDEGTVAETGTHKELMKNKGVYQKLFSTQAGRYIEAEVDG